MKKVTLLNKEYDVPTSWNDITVERYQKIHKILNEEVEDENDLTTILKQIDILSIYLNIPVDVLKREKPDIMMGLIKDLKFLREEIPSKQITEFRDKNNVKYYVLQTMLDTQFQDYISFENVLQRDDFIGNLHWLLAIMSRKEVNETLDDYDVEKRAEEFLELDMITVNNIAVFFCSLEKTLNLTSLLFSNPKEILEMKIQEVENSFKKQDGMGWRIRLQTGIIKRWFNYYVRQVRKSFIYTHQN